MCDLKVENAKLTSEQIEFIQTFTRMEFALKECGFIAGNNKHVSPDWNRFANEVLKKSFYEDEKKLSGALCKHPPKIQIYENNTLDWRKVDAPNCIQELIGAVTRIRNNLLHGGKHGNPDSDRDEMLVSESVELLRRAALVDADIKNAFEGLY